MQRYFIDPTQLNNDYITINGGDVHHIKNVMRMKVGDEIICACDGLAYLCEINSIGDNVSCKVLSKITKNSELKGRVSIAHGLVRREKTEEVVRRLTELGCITYIPLIMKRSIIKVDKVNDFKIDRYERIVKEASEQSQRNVQMHISPVTKIEELVSNLNQYDLLLLADANEENHRIKDIDFSNDYRNILVIIGPEGGFDDSEKQLLVSKGFKVVSFGNRVLRTETAPLYAMSVLSYILGEEDED